MSLFFWWVLFPLAAFFGLGSILGAPYLPIRKQDRDELLELAGLAPGQSIIDLGSGDGTFLKAAAKKGIRATGYEINPLLCVVSYVNCYKYRNLVTIKFGDFWRQPLPKTDVIYVFLIDRYMAKLEGKLNKEITTPTTVISYIFELPHIKPAKSTRNAHIYKLGFPKA